MRSTGQRNMTFTAVITVPLSEFFSVSTASWSCAGRMREGEQMKRPRPQPTIVMTMKAMYVESPTVPDVEWKLRPNDAPIVIEASRVDATAKAIIDSAINDIVALVKPLKRLNRHCSSEISVGPSGAA
jgi:hypothetical protein